MRTKVLNRQEIINKFSTVVLTTLQADFFARCFRDLGIVFLILKFPSISVMSDTFENNNNYHNILTS